MSMYERYFLIAHYQHSELRLKSRRLFPMEPLQTGNNKEGLVNEEPFEPEGNGPISLFIMLSVAIMCGAWLLRRFRPSLWQRLAAAAQSAGRSFAERLPSNIVTCFGATYSTFRLLAVRAFVAISSIVLLVPVLRQLLPARARSTTDEAHTDEEAQGLLGTAPPSIDNEQARSNARRTLSGGLDADADSSAAGMSATGGRARQATGNAAEGSGGSARAPTAEQHGILSHLSHVAQKASAAVAALGGDEEEPPRSPKLASTPGDRPGHGRGAAFKQLPKLVGYPPDLKPVLTHSNLRLLQSALPRRCEGSTWRCVFHTHADGYSLQTLYRKAGQHADTMMVVMSKTGHTMAAFCSRPWRPQRHFFGTGETTVLSLHPHPGKYSWTQSNKLFQLAKPQALALGGGEGGFALYLNDTLQRGTSSACGTFGNTASLLGEEQCEIVCVELWALV